MLKRVAKAILPKGGLAYRAAKKVALRTGLLSPAPIDVRYLEWVESVEPLIWAKPQKLAYRPLISIVVPVFNPPEADLREAVFSVVNQSYENWELILINASSDPACRQQTENCQQIDTRIKIVNIAKNLGIAGNTNEGLKTAQGEYVALMDHDDLLAQAALYEVAVALQSNPRPQLIYSDEDKLTARSGQRYDAHFKPDWSPHLFRQVNYLNHFTVIEKKLVDTVGAYRSGFDGAQDYDFYLRLVDENPVIYHLPKVLYHWRAAETSTASDFSKKKNILEAGIRALQDHLERNKLHGEIASLKDQPGFYVVKYHKPSIEQAIVIMGASSANQYAEYVRLAAKEYFSKLDNVKIYVNGLQANQKFLKEHEGFIINIEGQSDQAFVAEVLKRSKAGVFAFIDAAVLPKNKHWLDELSGLVTQCEEVAIAVPMLVDKDAGIIADAGKVATDNGLLDLYQGYPVHANTPFGNSLWPRNLDSISGRTMVMTRQSAEKYLLPSSLHYGAMCSKIIQDKLQIIMRPQTILNYKGDLKLTFESKPTFNPSLIQVRSDFSYPKLARMVKSGDDNA